MLSLGYIKKHWDYFDESFNFLIFPSLSSAVYRKNKSAQILLSFITINVIIYYIRPLYKNKSVF